MKKVFLAGIAVLCLLASGCANGTNRNNEMQPLRYQDQGRNMQQMQNQARTGIDAEDRVEIAQAAAERIDKLPGVQQANVLVTSRNAYVAAVLDGNNQQLSRQKEDQIAREVRKVHPNIQNVYVSTNPDFVDHINSYMMDVQQGRPVAGFVDQLNEMVQRIFPNAR